MPDKTTSSSSSHVRRDAIDRRDRIVRVLLQASARVDGSVGVEEVKKALDKSRKRGEPTDAYSTVSAHLRSLTGRGDEKGAKKADRAETEQVAVQTYVVNPFQTRFCHEFRIEIRVDGKRVSEEYGEPRAGAGKRRGHAGKRKGGPVERFIDKLISDVSTDPEFRDHLIITDAAILHGAPDRDIEFSVLTDDGSFSINRYVRDKLLCYEGVERFTTVTVGWRYRFDGYSGQHTNHRASSPASTLRDK